MAHKTHDLAVKTGTYQDREGNEKGRWMNVGALMENDEGQPFLMLNAAFNPAGVTRKEGSESILISCFEPQEQEQRPQRQSQQRPAPRTHGDRPGGPKNRVNRDEFDDTPF